MARAMSRISPRLVFRDAEDSVEKKSRDDALQTEVVPS